MKNFLLLVFVSFMITGCGSELKEIDIKKAATVIEKSLTEMVDVDKNTLEQVYGLDFDTIEDYVIKQNNSGNMYAIILTNDKATLKENIDEYFDKVRDYNTAYSPEQVQILDDRLEKEIGNYLIYIVAEDSESIYENIIDTIE